MTPSEPPSKQQSLTERIIVSVVSQVHGRPDQMGPVVSRLLRQAQRHLRAAASEGSVA